MSLHRVLEPEVMDSPDESRDYDSMDHTEVNQQFVSDLIGEGETTGDILDLGTGTAQIPVVLCQVVEECRVMAVDLSISMLELARYNIEVAGVIDRVMLDHVDAKELPFPDDNFDIVISNSILHHIPEPKVVIHESIRVARPGGRLFFRDLLRPEDDQSVERLVSAYARDASESQRRLFDDSLRAALSLDEVRAIVDEMGFDVQTVQQTSDRHWTWAAQVKG